MKNQTDAPNETPQDLHGWGAQNVAYITKVQGDGGQIAYAIHSADGTRLALAPTREIAFAAVLQHELEPVSVH